jgi:hypothetical protein
MSPSRGRVFSIFSEEGLRNHVFGSPSQTSQSMPFKRSELSDFAEFDFENIFDESTA